jgi:serine/threonine protein kinase
MIADLGFCKKVPIGSKTYTICGTVSHRNPSLLMYRPLIYVDLWLLQPEYISPEVIQASGHDQSSDLWCLGVLLYEMVVGATPFYDKDRQVMFQKICDRDLRVPRAMSQNLRDLLDKLLQPVPNRRLGGGRGGCHDVLSHPWFKGFDWSSFVSREMVSVLDPLPLSLCLMSFFDCSSGGTLHPDTKEIRSEECGRIRVWAGAGQARGPRGLS